MVTRWHVDLPLPQPAAYVRFLIDADTDFAAVRRAHELAEDRGWRVGRHGAAAIPLGPPKEVIGPGGHKVSNGAE